MEPHDLTDFATLARDLCARFDADSIRLDVCGNGRDYSIAAWRGGIVSAVDVENRVGLRIESDGEIRPHPDVQPHPDAR